MEEKKDFFWRKGYFESLTTLANEASAVPAWSNYSEYCRTIERGLRKQAFEILNEFLHSMEDAPFDERRRFVSWLLTRSHRREGKEVLIPHPVRERLVNPTLREWLDREPENSELHRWLGGYEHLKTAVELDPNDQISRGELIVQMLSRVGFHAHHLPNGYLGIAEEDFASLEEIETHVAKLQDATDREIYLEAATEYRSQIEAYMRL